LDVGRDVIGLGTAQRKIHLGVRPNQIENQRFGIEAIFSSDREERRSVRNEIVARTAGHDMTRGAALLRQLSAAFEIGGMRLRSCEKNCKTTDGNAIHQRPPAESDA
jgi:hypothetical protein